MTRQLLTLALAFFATTAFSQNQNDLITCCKNYLNGLHSNDRCCHEFHITQFAAMRTEQNKQNQLIAALQYSIDTLNLQVKPLHPTIDSITQGLEAVEMDMDSIGPQIAECCSTLSEAIDSIGSRLKTGFRRPAPIVVNSGWHVVGFPFTYGYAKTDSMMTVIFSMTIDITATGVDELVLQVPDGYSAASIVIGDWNIFEAGQAFEGRLSVNQNEISLRKLNGQDFDESTIVSFAGGQIEFPIQ